MPNTNSLTILDKHPQADATGFAINDEPWVQFSESLDVNTVTYSTFNIVEDVTFTPAPGVVKVFASPGTPGSGVSDTTVKFVPTDNFKRFTTYFLIIQDDDFGIKSKSGNQLDRQYSWKFTTGSGVIELLPGGTPGGSGAPSISPTGVSAAVVSPPSGFMEVVSTTPSNRATNIPTNIEAIEVKFNDVPASGVDLYRFFEISSKPVLG